MIPVRQTGRHNHLALALAFLLFFGLLVMGVVGNIRNGNYIAAPLIFSALALFGGAIWFSRYRVRVAMRDRTPDRLIAHYHRSVRRIPHAPAAAGYLSALAAAFFGQFDRARAELDAVDWENTTRMYRGHRLYVLSMLALLEETDYPKSLRLADEAAELERLDPAGGLGLLDHAIRLVADKETEERLDRLQRTARKQHGLMPAICAWSLAVYYKRKGDAERASEFTAILKDAVPHCAALQYTPPVNS